jgi:hypothetical protein
VGGRHCFETWVNSKVLPFANEKYFHFLLLVNFPKSKIFTLKISNLAKLNRYDLLKSKLRQNCTVLVMIMQKSYDFSKMEKNLASYAVCHTIKGCIHIITSALNLLQSTENSEKVNSFLIFLRLYLFIYFLQYCGLNSGLTP